MDKEIKTINKQKVVYLTTQSSKGVIQTEALFKPSDDSDFTMDDLMAWATRNTGGDYIVNIDPDQSNGEYDYKTVPPRSIPFTGRPQLSLRFPDGRIETYSILTLPEHHRYQKSIAKLNFMLKNKYNIMR